MLVSSGSTRYVLPDCTCTVGFCSTLPAGYGSHFTRLHGSRFFTCLLFCWLHAHRFTPHTHGSLPVLHLLRLLPPFFGFLHTYTTMPLIYWFTVTVYARLRIYALRLHALRLVALRVDLHGPAHVPACRSAVPLPHSTVLVRICVPQLRYGC